MKNKLIILFIILFLTSCSFFVDIDFKKATKSEVLLDDNKIKVLLVDNLNKSIYTYSDAIKFIENQIMNYNENELKLKKHSYNENSKELRVLFETSSIKGYNYISGDNLKVYNFNSKLKLPNKMFTKSGEKNTSDILTDDCKIVVSNLPITFKTKSKIIAINSGVLENDHTVVFEKNKKNNYIFIMK